MSLFRALGDLLITRFRRSFRRLVLPRQSVFCSNLTGDTWSWDFERTQ